VRLIPPPAWVSKAPVRLPYGNLPGPGGTCQALESTLQRKKPRRETPPGPFLFRGCLPEIT
jgi:hypothetical protein